jgi:hypothetical protein
MTAERIDRGQPKLSGLTPLTSNIQVNSNTVSVSQVAQLGNKEGAFAEV